MTKQLTSEEKFLEENNIKPNSIIETRINEFGTYSQPLSMLLRQFADQEIGKYKNELQKQREEDTCTCDTWDTDPDNHYLTCRKCGLLTF